MNYISKNSFSPNRFSTEAMYENSPYLRKSFYKITVNDGRLDELREIDMGGKPIGHNLNTVLGTGSTINTVKEATKIKTGPKSLAGNVKTTIGRTGKSSIKQKFALSKKTKENLSLAGAFGIYIGCLLVHPACDD